MRAAAEVNGDCAAADERVDLEGLARFERILTDLP